MLDRVISGGQTGADQGALRAARAHGFATGGWAPKGWLTEVGPAPWLEGFGLVEMPTPLYSARTAANVRDSDATLWFGSMNTAGALATLDACRSRGKPCLCAPSERDVPPSIVLAWIRECRVGTLNVAGNRESAEPGIGERVERFMADVFRRLGHAPPP